MATTREEIRTWLKEGKAQGATHTIVVCDTFDYEDYPVHVMPGRDVRAESKQYDGTNMQRIMECYSHALDHEKQLNEHRSSHWEYPTPNLTSEPYPTSEPEPESTKDVLGELYAALYHEKAVCGLKLSPNLSKSFQRARAHLLRLEGKTDRKKAKKA